MLRQYKFFSSNPLFVDSNQPFRVYNRATHTYMGFPTFQRACHVAKLILQRAVSRGVTAPLPVSVFEVEEGSTSEEWVKGKGMQRRARFNTAASIIPFPHHNKEQATTTKQEI